MVGGLGHCGQELCCKRLGGEFCPVSIRMAKEQDLSLNPQKISGVCGRLMCCLRYEFEAYKDFKSRAPKQNSTVDTPAGPAKVVDLDVPRETVSLKVEGEKPVKVPLADFEPPEEGSARPKAVGEEAWEAASARTAAGAAGESSIFATSQLTGADKLADPGAVRRVGRGGQRSAAPARDGRPGAGEGAGPSGRKPRRRRSTKVGGEAAPAEGGEARKRAKQQKPQKQQGAAAAKGAGPKGGQGSQQKKRSGAGGGKGRPTARPSDAPKRQGQAGPKQRSSQGASKQGGPRPGQRSSGLRQERVGQRPRPERSERPERAAGADEGHRRARRRSHRAGGAGSAGTGGAGEGA